jgi:toxin YoeB
MELDWQTHAWEDYLYWQETDKKVLLKIKELIKDCLRNPFICQGRPNGLPFPDSQYSFKLAKYQPQLKL